MPAFIKFVFIILLSYSINGVAASMFGMKEEEVVLGSPMEGIITFHGKVMSGVKVERHLKWQDDEGESESVMTDSDGKFILPLRKETVKLSTISTFVTTQEIRVYIDGKDYLVWTMGKSSKALYGELGGKPENLRCELSDDDTPMRLEDALLMTKCKWDSIISQ